MSMPPPGPGPGPGAPPPYSPPPVYAPSRRPPAPAKRRRFHPLLIVAGGFVLLFIVCSVISQLGSSVGKKLSTTEAGQAATAHAIAPTQVVAQGAPQNTTAPAPPATPADTAVPAVPPTPAPPTATPVPMLGFADTATFPDWVMSLGKLETHAQLAGATAQGRYWVVALDARNTGAAAHPLTVGFTFMLRDSSGKETPALSGAGVDSATKAAGREALSKVAKPKGLVHPLLVFDLPATTLPQQLVIRRADPASEVWYDLVATAQAQATVEVQAQGTRDAEAQVAAFNTRVADDAAKAKAAGATATAGQRKLESYKNTAPAGEFSATGQRVAISCTVKYQRCIQDFCADPSSKFIVLNVGIGSGGKSLAVNPLYFTLISTDRGAVAIDSNTFLLGNPLQAITLQPHTTTGGQLAFLTLKEFIPGQLVWDDYSETLVVPIVSVP